MTTTVESLQNAATALGDATGQVIATRQQVLQDHAAVLANANAILAQALSQGEIRLVDPTNGNDNNNGRTAATAFQTIDKFFSIVTPNTTWICALLGDVEVKKMTAVTASKVMIFGANAGTGLAGEPFVGATRTMTFRGEALNSPHVYYGRTTAGMDLQFGGTLHLIGINPVIADVPGSLANSAHALLSNGGSLRVVGNVTGITPGNVGRLARIYQDSIPPGFWLEGGLGSGAVGRLLLGVAAGANPNTNGYRSNLTSA